jgi:hypothetical protein
VNYTNEKKLDDPERRVKDGGLSPPGGGTDT